MYKIPMKKESFSFISHMCLLYVIHFYPSFMFILYLLYRCVFFFLISYPQQATKMTFFSMLYEKIVNSLVLIYFMYVLCNHFDDTFIVIKFYFPIQLKLSLEHCFTY